jgi:RNA polymerase sigma-70 factor, ECF subfamily
MDNNSSDRRILESRFVEVFDHLGFIAAYARRRGAQDAESIAGEAMAIAWRRLADVPKDDARPWLIATTRNLLMAERRRDPQAHHHELDGLEIAAPEELLSPDLDLDPELAAALRALSDQDREALLLIAWEDLTPTLAAASLGITAAAFRVRLHRARRRLSYYLVADVPAGTSPSPRLDRTHS